MQFTAESNLLRVTVAVVVLYDFWLLWRIAHASQFATRGKLALTLLVIAIPILGALGIHALLASDNAPPRRRDPRFVEQTPNDQGPVE
jgi:hypothetical protein